MIHLLVLLQPIATAPQSALQPAGPVAARIDALWDFMLWTSVVITLAVFGVMAYALFRKRQGEVPEADRPKDSRGESNNRESGDRGSEESGRPASERIGVRAMVAAGIVFPAVVLGIVHVFTMRTLGAIALPSHWVATETAPPQQGEIAIQVTAHQYWWRVQYLDHDMTQSFESANEIRIPVGQRVTIRLRSADVIHSFWVPALHGKMDLIPGRTNAIAIQADSAGTWRGQCAEFCGIQHAKMALVVVAMPEASWNAWLAEQRRPARMPADSAEGADAQAFLASGCVLCHTVRGTPARAAMGPDLTHVASRLTLAAGTFPNTRGHLYGWVADPQSHKPGSHMPALPLTPDQLQSIVRYLQTLE